ncbi:DNA replication complex GINS protein SLD5 [Aricia agestis]|uniref:DNA replication complex GINS protein SLD5 n=1 Tax=Aricia agestis TaxID=91739 RepID=UPI001C20AE13|nr:DNA replication complex GINS protein SLD5 [Aricia agestis]
MDSEDIQLSDEEEEVTAEAVLKVLQNAWQNERLAPEILPHRNDMIECMLGQIQHMERNINKLPKTDFRALVHKMELSRIKYIICNYLKTRLDKIEKFCISIVNDERHRIENGTSYLTEAEYRYAQDYLQNIESHMKVSVLNHIPGNMQTFEPNRMAVHPNLQSHVFLKAINTVNGIVLENLLEDQDEEIDLEEGSQHILQYRPIADLVKNGSVQLI